MSDETIIAIPLGKYKHRPVFQLRTLSTVKPAEFMNWIEVVYPGGLKEKDEEYFSSLEVRQYLFDAILNFWIKWLTPGIIKPENKK
jgi:hypothetical protein